MNPWFADTFFFLALLNRQDGHHSKAMRRCGKRAINSPPA
jgi:hypothetical protein